jgi:hypothetical protein
MYKVSLIGENEDKVEAMVHGLSLGYITMGT